MKDNGFLFNSGLTSDFRNREGLESFNTTLMIFKRKWFYYFVFLRRNKNVLSRKWYLENNGMDYQIHGNLVTRGVIWNRLLGIIFNYNKILFAVCFIIINFKINFVINALKSRPSTPSSGSSSQITTMLQRLLQYNISLVYLNNWVTFPKIKPSPIAPLNRKSRTRFINCKSINSWSLISYS